jgi:cytochrome P450
VETINPVSTPELPPLLSPAFIRDPYPTYRWHRSGPRVQQLDIRPNLFAMFRYADCVAWYRDPRLTAERSRNFWVNSECSDLAPFEDLIEHMQRWLLVQGPARHATLRKLMNRGFGPSVIERLKPRIATIVTQLIDSFDGREVDLVRDFAYPLPVYVISALLGVPEQRRARMVVLSNDLAVWFGNPRKTPAASAVAQTAIRELVGHFEEIIRSRRQRAGDDLLSLLLEISTDEEIGMSDADLHAQCVMLLFAGHETTRNLISNALYTLLTHREQWEQLRQDPNLARGVVEETLRYESPVQASGRTLIQEIEIDGVTLPAGASLQFMIGAAHRDEQQFDDPDRFDIRRPHIRHLAFGGDAHVCLGSTLARLEGQMAIGELVRRFPNLELLEREPEWSPIFVLRGLKTLRVSCS